MPAGKLKIALLVLPWIPLPPPGYAGTERVVYWLAEGLVKKGHKVTVFSVGESRTKAGLAYILKKPLGLQADVRQTLKGSFYPLMHVAYCFERQEEFDIIHSHAQFLALPFAALAKTPCLHTFHRTLKQGLEKDEKNLLQHYGWLNFTSVSNSQRIPGLNFLATVYHGLPLQKFYFNPKPKDNLLWVGRLTAKKGAKEAILTAKKLKMKLIMAGKVTEPEYFKKEIARAIDGRQIKYIGEVPQEKLVKYYGEALCLLFPSKWQEPFGLVMIEALACGCPVIAFNKGSVPEIVQDKKTGFIVQNTSQLAQAVKKIKQIKREECRAWVEKKFRVERMVDEYEKIYEQLVKR